MLKAASSYLETRMPYEMRKKALKDMISTKEGAREQGNSKKDAEKESGY